MWWRTRAAQPADDAVVMDETVLAQHDAVAAAPDPQLLPRVGVEKLEELGRVRPHHLDLAQRRGVEDAGGLPHGHAFAIHRRAHVLAGTRKIPCPLPLSDILEHRAGGLGPRVDRGPPHRIEQVAPRLPDHGAEGDGRVGRAEGGQPDFRHRSAQRLGGDGQPVQVRGLALVGGHAVGGEALDMLDRAHALAYRLADVPRRHVVLEIDERLLAADPRRIADHAAGHALALGPRPRAGLAGLDAGGARRRMAGGIGFGHRVVEIVGAVAGADADAVLRRLARQEALAGHVERHLAARLRVEVQRRRPAGRGDQRIDAD
jgi:hypothetical protein